MFLTIGVGMASSYYDFETSGLHIIELEKRCRTPVSVGGDAPNHVLEHNQSLLRCFLSSGMWLSG